MVKNQLFTPVLSLEGSSSLQKNECALRNNGSNYSVWTRQYRIESYFPLKANQKLLILAGGGYSDLDFGEAVEPWLPRDFKSLYATGIGTGNIGEKFFWLSIHTLGYYSYKLDLGDGSTLKYFQVSALGKKWNRGLSTYAGVMFNSNFGRIQVLPVIGIGYSTGRFVFDLLPPARMEFRFLANRSLHFLIFGKLLPEIYRTFSRVDGAKQNLEIIRSEAALKMEFRLSGWFWLQSGFTYLFKTPLNFFDSMGKTKLGTISSGVKFSIHLLVRPE